jgi:hypothetical protein
LQEQVNRETVAIYLKASNLTANTVQKAFMAVLHQIQDRYRNSQTPHGRQSVKKLMNHNVSTNTIQIEGDSGLFDKVARKWKVDYAFHQLSENKYLLLFKSSQADAVTAAFSEYSAQVIKRAKEKKSPVKEQFQKAEKETQRQQRKHKEHRREREHEPVRE